MNYGKNEEEFFEVFKELIQTFSSIKVENTTEEGFSISFIKNLEIQINSNITNSEGDVTQNRVDKKLEQIFEEFMTELKNTSFKHEIIPYDKITECVFENVPEEALYSFTSDLRSRGVQYFTEQHGKMNDINSDNEKMERKFYKIIRHIDLALVQKTNFTSIKLREVDELKEEYEKLQRDYKALKKDAETQYKGLLTQFIAILGIFAAIMMGAFGSMEGFISLFNNAENISIGKIMMISSIGASGVTLILFLLLYSISKLTKFNFSSCKCNTKNRKKAYETCNCSLFRRYPSIIIINYLLYFVFLSGFILMYVKHSNYFYNNVMQQLVVILIFYSVGMFVLWCAHQLLFTKKQNITLSTQFLKFFKKLKFNRKKSKNKEAGENAL